MDCSHFAEILADLEEGTLSPDEQSAARAHLAECSECRRLLEIAGGDIDILPQDGHDALARSILDRTSGSVCARIEASLWDFIEGELSIEDSHLLSLHLENCSECRSVAEELVLMQQELPAMAEIDPGEFFTQEVISGTSRARPSPSPIKAGFRAWWDRMIQRPRFSLEAAYVGALVLFLVFSIPLLSLQNISLDKISSATVQPSAKFFGSTWTGAKTYISDQLSEFISTAETQKQIASESLSKLAKSCESKSASILDRSAEGIKKWQKDQSIGWLIVWRNVSSWIPLAKI
jgi:anti-sigma factor RsiW